MGKCATTTKGEGLRTKGEGYSGTNWWAMLVSVHILSYLL